MHAPSRFARVCVGLVALVLPAAATTFVVDDDGGPGVDFTDLPAAVSAAQPGDVLLVAPGTYSSFAINKGISILGAGSASTRISQGTVTIQALPADEVAVFSGFGSGVTCCTPFHLRVWLNAGTVVLEDLSLSTDAEISPSGAVVSVIQSADVRIHRCTFYASILAKDEGYPGLTALFVDTSRVEVVQSSILGGVGDGACCFFDGGDGGEGIYARGASRVHVARSNVHGGGGGGVSEFLGTAGDGGPAIFVEAPAEVVVAGIATDTVRGGDRGIDYGSPPFDDGAAGPGVLVTGGRLRYSGVSLAGGSGGAPPLVVTGGTATTPAVPDPTLAVSGQASMGGVVTLTLSGTPGAFATLAVGRESDVLETPHELIELLLERSGGLGVGPLDATGMAARSYAVNALSPVVAWIQGELFAPGGRLRRTNSIPLVVR